MPQRTAQMLPVFLLALAVVTANMGSPRVGAQDQAASTYARPSDLAEKLAKIEKEVEEKRKELGVPGVAVAIVKDDKVIFQKGFGVRDVERNLPVTADTLFAIGSCTKSFTAMAAVISQDDGRLSLEDSPKKHLSYFRLQDPEADARITVRDLLHHSSGLALSDLVSSTGVLNRSEVIKVAGLAKPTAKFREKFQYQNVMYTAAGEVVAKANGTTWEKFIEERLFKPLGMKSSYTSLKQMVRVTNKKIGSQHEYFDGAQGGVENSPGESERYKDEQLESTRISSDYYEQLNWKTLYKTVAITQKSKVGDQEVYVVVKTPQKGNAVTDYISAKSFLLVKRAREGASEETIYSDYRNVDGEMVPFSFVMQGGDLGRIVARLQEARFNVHIPASTFRPAAK